MAPSSGRLVAKWADRLECSGFVTIIERPPPEGKQAPRAPDVTKQSRSPGQSFTHGSYVSCVALGSSAAWREFVPNKRYIAIHDDNTGARFMIEFLAIFWRER